MLRKSSCPLKTSPFHASQQRYRQILQSFLAKLMCPTKWVSSYLTYDLGFRNLWLVVYLSHGFSLTGLDSYFLMLNIHLFLVNKSVGIYKSNVVHIYVSSRRTVTYWCIRCGLFDYLCVSVTTGSQQRWLVVMNSQSFQHTTCFGKAALIFLRLNLCTYICIT